MTKLTDQCVESLCELHSEGMAFATGQDVAERISSSDEIFMAINHLKLKFLGSLGIDLTDKRPIKFLVGIRIFDALARLEAQNRVVADWQRPENLPNERGLRVYQLHNLA